MGGWLVAQLAGALWFRRLTMDFLFKLSVSRRLVVLVGFAVAAMAVVSA